MPELIEFVPDHILRNYVRVGQKVTVLKGSVICARFLSQPNLPPWHYKAEDDLGVTIVNFLPGYTEVYAPRTVHNHQAVWKGQTPGGEVYYSTDINNVKEVRDAAV